MFKIKMFKIIYWSMNINTSHCIYCKNQWKIILRDTEHVSNRLILRKACFSWKLTQFDAVT